MSKERDREPKLEERVKGNLGRSVAYLMGLEGLLRDEAERALDISFAKTQSFVEGAIDFKEQQFWFRVMIRSFFAYVEGMTFAMRRIVIWGHQRGELALSPEEVMVLREERGFFERGRIKSVEKHNPFAENVQIAFLFFPRFFGASFELPTSNQGWESFRRAERLRNRVTHPKCPEDLMIEHKEMQHVLSAMRWFMDCIMQTFKACDYFKNTVNPGASKQE